MPAVRKRLLAALVAGLLAVPLAAVVLGTGSVADARSAWAPESAATIKPGVQMYTAGAQCTSNFVFKDKAGNVYVGYAAHCAGKGQSSDTNGCTTPALPLGTAVTFVTGGNFFSAGKTVGTGKLAYTSWGTMHKLKTKDKNRCAFNDFALVRLAKASVVHVNPTVPKWGGPMGVAPLLKVGAALYTVGNSSLRSGNASAKTGKVLAVDGGGLAYELRTGSPGIPGDSGSGFMNGKGLIAGVLSTINVGLGLTPVSNTMGNLSAELAWAQKYSGITGLVLVTGTRVFKK